VHWKDNNWLEDNIRQLETDNLTTVVEQPSYFSPFSCQEIVRSIPFLSPDGQSKRKIFFSKFLVLFSYLSSRREILF
jgi:hypothetical protein